MGRGGRGGGRKGGGSGGWSWRRRLLRRQRRRRLERAFERASARVRCDIKEETGKLVNVRFAHWAIRRLYGERAQRAKSEAKSQCSVFLLALIPRGKLGSMRASSKATHDNTPDKTRAKSSKPHTSPASPTPSASYPCRHTAGKCGFRARTGCLCSSFG